MTYDKSRELLAEFRNTKIGEPKPACQVDEENGGAKRVANKDDELDNER